MTNHTVQYSAIIILLLFGVTASANPNSEECSPNSLNHSNQSSQTKPSSCLGLGEPSSLNLVQSPKAQSTTTEKSTQHMNQSSQHRTTKVSPRGDLNVLGTPLKQCCTSPMTGFERDGFCHTGPRDHGRHVVCAVMDERFLTFTKAQGNDLSTAIPAYGFPGLKPGDRWCLCALRWLEAQRTGYAPSIDLESTHKNALDYVPLELLKQHALPSQHDLSNEK